MHVGSVSNIVSWGSGRCCLHYWWHEMSSCKSVCSKLQSQRAAPALSSLQHYSLIAHNRVKFNKSLESTFSGLILQRLHAHWLAWTGDDQLLKCTWIHQSIVASESWLDAKGHARPGHARPQNSYKGPEYSWETTRYALLHLAPKSHSAGV